MPELPEVEAIRRRLTAQLKGRVIRNAFVLKPQTVAFPKGDAFAQAVRGAMVEQLRRRGKFLLLDLNNGQTMVVHLRMTGRLLVTAHEIRRRPTPICVLPWTMGGSCASWICGVLAGFGFTIPTGRIVRRVWPSWGRSPSPRM